MPKRTHDGVCQIRSSPKTSKKETSRPITPAAMASMIFTRHR